MVWPWQAYRAEHPYVDPYVDHILSEQEDGFKRDMSEIQLGFNRDLLSEIGRQTEQIKRLNERMDHGPLIDAFNALKWEVRAYYDTQTQSPRKRLKTWIVQRVNRWAVK